MVNIATINGVTFNLDDVEPVVVHNNVVDEQPGSDTNFVNDMGYDGLVLRITGYEKTLAKYDEVINEFMKPGEHTLIYRSCCQYKVSSVQLNPILIEGVVDNYFPYDLTMVSTIPYRESITLKCRTREINENNQEWSAENAPCDNILENWNFENWSAGSTNAPDGWTIYGTGVDVERDDTTEKYGSYCCKLIRTDAYSYMKQVFSNYADYRGLTMTFGVWAKTSVANRARLKLDDGVAPVTSGYHTGSGDWEWLEVTIDVDDAASELETHVGINNGTDTIYWDGAVFIIGDSIPDHTFERNIDTDGNVDAIPDIEIKNKSIPLGIIKEYSTFTPTDLAWDGSNIWSCNPNTDKIYKHNPDMTIHTTYDSPEQYPNGLTWDGSNFWSCDQAVDKIYKHNSDMTVNTTYNSPGGAPTGLAWDGTNIWSVDFALDKIYKHNADMTVNTSYDSPEEPTGIAWDGTNFWTCSAGLDKIYKHNADLTVRNTFNAPGPGANGLVFDDNSRLWYADTSASRIYILVTGSIKDVDVYNTDDSTVKCELANEVLIGATHRINVDGTGSIYYEDDFSTEKWGLDAVGSGVTHDSVNDEIDIADDGYIYRKCDTKCTITGIPALIAQINITSGIPTIQISADASTWYDIETAIVDDVETVYDLFNKALVLKGNNIFYWRIDCVKTEPATCSIKSVILEVDMVTIDFEHPRINESGNSTFRCDQGTDSGMACELRLFYRDRSWPV